MEEVKLVMRRIRLPIIAALAFVLTLFSGLTAGASSNPTPTVDGEFPIGIFHNPPPSATTDSAYADIRAMNANFIVSTNLMTTPATTDWALKMAQNNDLKILVTDTGIRWYQSEWISQNDDTDASLYLRNDRALGQTFTTPDATGMAVWKLSFKKAGAWPAGTSVTLNIYDSPAKTTHIATSTLSGPVVTDFPEFTINGAVVAAETDYYFELTTDSVTDLGPFLASTGDQYGDGDLYVNGVAAGNDLYFQMTLPKDGGGNWSAFSPTSRSSDNFFTTYVNHYKDHPALLGYNLVDEPFGDQFPHLQSATELIRTLDPDHMVYTNLYGLCPTCMHYYSGTDDPLRGSYQDYVNGWLDTDPDIISFDHYPFYSTGFDEAWYLQLEYYRERSLLYDTDLWVYIQAMQYDYYNMIEPSEEQMRFQIYSSLAYGAKGYVYFTYYTPDGMDNGLILPDGSKNDTYYYAQDVNAEVLNLGSTLLGLTSKEVYQTGGTPPYTTALPSGFFWQPTTGAPEMPMIVSLLEDEDGREYVMIVNKDMEDAHLASFTLSGSPASVTEISKTTGLEVGTSYNATTGVLTANFEPGEGRLYALPAPPAPSAAPAWEEGSELAASQATTSSIRLTWPAAAAGGEAAGYRIYANGGLQGSVAGDVLTYTVSGLASGTSYGFKVVAVDANDEEHGLLERTASTANASNGYVPPADPPSSGGKTEEENGGDNGENEEDNDFDSERAPLFGDIAGDHPAWEAIAEALERGIVTGYADMTFRPQAPVTRAAFVTMLVRALELPAAGQAPPFRDVAAGAWHAGAVGAAYEAGLINGVDGERFAPDRTISREQMATLLVRAYAYLAGADAPPFVPDESVAYQDEAAVAEWARASVNQVLGGGIMELGGDGLFQPRTAATRVEAVEAILKLLGMMREP
jgi:hypothetical protein